MPHTPEQRKAFKERRFQERYDMLVSQGKHREAAKFKSNRESGLKSACTQQKEATAKASIERGLRGRPMTAEEKIERNSIFKGDTDSPHDKFTTADSQGLQPAYNTEEKSLMTTDMKEGIEKVKKDAERKLMRVDDMRDEIYSSFEKTMASGEVRATDIQKIVSSYLALEERSDKLLRIVNFGVLPQPQKAPVQKQSPTTAIQINNPKQINMVKPNGHAATVASEPPPPELPQ